MSASCVVAQGICDIRERPVQGYSEEFGLGAEGQGFVVEVDFHLTFSILVVKVEGCRHRFCSAELSAVALQLWAPQMLTGTPNGYLQNSHIMLHLEWTSKQNILIADTILAEPGP